YATANTFTVVGGIVLAGGNFGFGDHFLERFALANGDPIQDLHFLPPVVAANGDCHLTLRGQSASTYRIEASADLRTWTPLMTNAQPRIPIGLVDPGANHKERFYRVNATQ